MKNEILYSDKLFESIKHIDENGVEYWEARELQKVLEYKEWRNFKKVLGKAMIACKLSNNEVFEQFVELNKPIVGGNGNIQNVLDYKLSRYACYLIVQNGNPKKEVIALGQTYFAIQTRKQEITEMGSTELAANLFRVTQTEDVLDKKKIKGEEEACDTHYKAGKAVRNAIKEIGSTMPEKLPTPEKFVKEIKTEMKQ